jgi:peptidoglycan hydrolase-like protein with peptidoglycan-binding domain
MAFTAQAPAGVLSSDALRRTLHVVSPLLRGQDVLALQESLQALGYAPGPLDGFYGVATSAALRAFQADYCLDADGVCGPQTIAVLSRARPSGGPRAGRYGGASGRRALAEAISHIGLVERPVNLTPFGEWFGVDGVPWCNIFVSYCFRVGAQVTLCAGVEGAGVYSKGCAYVPTTAAWLRATGQWIGRATPLPGDIAIFDWDGAGAPEHIGIVEKALGGGKFQSIEGNTSLASDSNGGAVMRRVRLLSQVEGFGRIGS